MTTRPVRHLLDVNVLVALLDKSHTHNEAAERWFHQPGRRWALCAFTEAALLRYTTRPSLGNASMEDALAMLWRLTREPGYYYQAISADWQTLCGRFAPRLFGYRQITDAYLLGLAIEHGLVLVTFDRAILHLAGEDRDHVHLLTQ